VKGTDHNTGLRRTDSKKPSSGGKGHPKSYRKREREMLRFRLSTIIVCGGGDGLNLSGGRGEPVTPYAEKKKTKKKKKQKKKKTNNKKKGKKKKKKKNKTPKKHQPQKKKKKKKKRKKPKNKSGKTMSGGNV